VHFVVNPSTLKGATIEVPGDKSISHRALMLAAIADGTSTISNFLNGEDCLATQAAMQAMGVSMETPDARTVRVHGVGMSGLQAPVSPLDLGNSGTGMRLLAGLLCGQPFDSCLTGDASLSRRPMRRIIEPLERMGARIDGQDGMPPLSIRGNRKLKRIDYQLPVASAQVKSAILLASLYASGECRIVEPAPTRDHTERMLAGMGVDLDQGPDGIRMSGAAKIRATSITVPGDLSSAAFIILGALVSGRGETRIEGVGMNPTRTGIIDILLLMGADIRLENRRVAGFEPVADIRVNASRLRGIDVDPGLVSLAIDEFPVLFIAAAHAAGRTRFSGIGELRVKESDRIGAMASGLRCLGIEVEETPDGAVVHGGKLSGGIIDSFEDHRVAMSFAVAATAATDPVTIRDIDPVDTSFPGFADCLRAVGADITVVDRSPA
jgi:3-phosphoshikimate 1-carboxyvinyltransferase